MGPFGSSRPNASPSLPRSTAPTDPASLRPRPRRDAPVHEPHDSASRRPTAPPRNPIDVSGLPRAPRRADITTQEYRRYIKKLQTSRVRPPDPDSPAPPLHGAPEPPGRLSSGTAMHNGRPRMGCPHEDVRRSPEDERGARGRTFPCARGDLLSREHGLGPVNLRLESVGDAPGERNGPGSRGCGGGRGQRAQRKPRALPRWSGGNQPRFAARRCLGSLTQPPPR